MADVFVVFQMPSHFSKSGGVWDVTVSSQIYVLVHFTLLHLQFTSQISFGDLVVSETPIYLELW